MSNAWKMYKRLVAIETMRIFPSNVRGRPRKLKFDDAFDCILDVVRTGMQWRRLRPEHCSYITVFKTMHKWASAGVFRTAYIRLLELYSRRRRPKYYCIDSSYVKNVYGRDCTGRNPTDRGRRASKLSTIVDDMGIPHTFHAAPGNTSDQRLLEPLLSQMLVPPVPAAEMFADKGYDSARNRAHCREYGLRDRIFKRRTINGPRTHAKRGVIERFFSWHDKYRRLLVRYEQGIGIYLEMTYLAAGNLLANREIFGVGSV